MSLPVEIERRWLVTNTNIISQSDYERFHIVQGYLAKAKGLAIRVRIQTNAHISEVKCFLTFEGSKDTQGKAIELEYEIPQVDAKYLMQNSESNLKKNRYIFNDCGTLVHLDMFLLSFRDPAIHNIVEVEFKTQEDADAFKPLPWFGKEITNESEYSNYSIAFNGWPIDKEEL